MLKHFKLFFFSLVMILLPCVVNASSFNYTDQVYDIVGETESTKVTVYFFYSSSCVHCKAENARITSYNVCYTKLLRVVTYQ